jgi:hypothetical protein
VRVDGCRGDAVAGGRGGDRYVPGLLTVRRHGSSGDNNRRRSPRSQMRFDRQLATETKLSFHPPLSLCVCVQQEKKRSVHTTTDRDLVPLSDLA